MIRLINRTACVVLLAVSTAAAQDTLQGPPQGPAGPPRAQAGADVSPAEMQRLFDAYALVQAQEVLGLDDTQYATFVTAMKALQETRRRNQQERTRLLRDLARMAGPKAPAGSDQEITTAIASLKDLDAKAAAELSNAYDAVDQSLTLRQRARFRLFEEQLERRKIELLLRARQPRRENAIRERGW
jgi:hypothetical protein